MTEELPVILTLPEVAEWLRVPINTLRYWRRVQTGPPSWRSGLRIYYDKAEVMAWLAEQRRSTAHPTGTR